MADPQPAVSEINARSRILVISNSMGDAPLLAEVFGSSPMFSLRFEQCATKALDLIRSETRRELRPNLIIVPATMGAITVVDFLRTIKSDGELRSIPVVVLGTLPSAETALELYSAGASCVINRPFGLELFIQTVSIIKTFWVDTATLPS